MADETAIEWTDSTWNIVTGCTRVSPGCTLCYIVRTPPFRMAGRAFERVGNESTTGVRLHPERLARVPRGPKVFTPSLGDLFHEDVPDEFIAQAFAVMALHGDRVFQVLTKRPERMRDWFAWATDSRISDAICDLGYDERWPGEHDVALPLPNVWLGVSIENARFTWRADVLRQIPAAVRFISAEPLLGSLYDAGVGFPCTCRDVPVTERPVDSAKLCDPFKGGCGGVKTLDLTGIDWVIVGGESGPGARPMRLDWAREIITAAKRQECCGRWTSACCGRYLPTGECCGDAVPACCYEPDIVGPAVFVKQLGAKPIYLDDLTIGVYREKPLKLRDRKGGDPDEWPADLRIREFPARAGAAA